MAAGDTSLSICSDALILLGAAPISSFTEGSDAAQACDRLYPDLRDNVIANYMWSWSVKKVQIARLSTNPLDEWKYAYQLPGDMLSGLLLYFPATALINLLQSMDGIFTEINYLQILKRFLLIIKAQFQRLKCQCIL